MYFSSCSYKALEKSYHKNGIIKSKKITFKKSGYIEYYRFSNKGEMIYRSISKDTSLISLELYTNPPTISSEKKLFTKINNGISVYFDSTGNVKTIRVGSTRNSKEYLIEYDLHGMPEFVRFPDENNRKIKIRN